MAFGIPGSEPNAGGQFLGRLQYDARVGFWKVVKRVQQSDGGWDDDASEPFKNPTFLLDVGTLEVGYIKFASPPAFLVVPFGQEIPPRPADRVTDAEGKSRSAYLPGFRVKVYNPKLFGDADAYYFANNSKTVLEPMDALHTLAIQAPEAKAGKVPGIKVTGTTPIRIEGPRGNNTYYAPVFEITKWYDRPDCFGPRTVPVPGGSLAKPKTNGASKTAAPAPKVDNEDWEAPIENAPENRVALPAGSIDDEIPF